MTGHEHDQSIAQSLGALARDGLSHDAFDDAGGRARLLERAERDRSSWRFPSARFVLVPALVVVGALVVWLFVPRRLGYEVEGVRASGSYVNAPLDRSAIVRFSDDSRIEVAKGSQVRVEETSRRGARVLLERGQASVHVVHRERADWTFVAGPCEVLVTGTSFNLDWDPGREVLEVRLREGTVEIQTPLSPARVTLRTGQEFRADLGRRTTMTAETGNGNRHGGETASAASSAAPTSGAATPAEVAPALGSAPSVSAVPAAKIPWTKLVAEGKFKAVLTQAEARGIDDCLSSCPAAELGALADAARYSGRTELAERSLQALRSRFSGEPAGRAAAFLLGRLREGRGAPNDAKAWYERYLAESPSGSYASEALAGKMRTTLAASGPAQAEPIAREYLRLYPTGVHAGTARDILGSR